jgi:hypothetical protein
MQVCCQRPGQDLTCTGAQLEIMAHGGLISVHLKNLAGKREKLMNDAGDLSFVQSGKLKIPAFPRAAVRRRSPTRWPNRG